MKNVFFIIFISFLISFFLSPAQAQFDTIRIEFAPSQYELEKNFIALPKGGRVMKVIGVANKLPNRNGMSNAELAQKRADELGFDSSIEHEAIVFNDDRADHRAVWIIVKKEIDVEKIERLETQWQRWVKFEQIAVERGDFQSIKRALRAKVHIDTLIKKALRGYDVEVPSTAPTPQKNKIKIKEIKLKSSNNLDSISPSTISCDCKVMQNKESQELEALAYKSPYWGKSWAAMPIFNLSML